MNTTSTAGRALQSRTTSTSSTSANTGSGGGNNGVSNGGLTSEVRNIMENVVSESSVRAYTNGIVNFFIWVFEDITIKHILFKDWFLLNLSVTNAKDLALLLRQRKAKKH